MPQNGNDTFDYAAAKKAGYSDSEIQGYLHQNYGFDFDITSAKKSGYSDNEINGYLSQQNLKKKVGGTGNGINVNTQSNPSLNGSGNGIQHPSKEQFAQSLQNYSANNQVSSNASLGVDAGMMPVSMQRQGVSASQLVTNYDKSQEDKLNKAAVNTFNKTMGKGSHTAQDSTKYVDQLKQGVKNGDLMIAPDASGKDEIKNTGNAWQSFWAASDKAHAQSLENNYLRSLPKDKAIQYLNDKRANPDAFEFKTTYAPNGLSGFAGEQANILGEGVVGSLAGAETGVTGGASAGTFLAMVNDLANSGYSQSLQKNYNQLKDEGLNDSEAFDKATKAGLVGEAGSLLQGALLSGEINLKSKPSSMEGFLNSMAHTFKSSPKVLGTTALASVTNDIATNSLSNGTPIDSKQMLKNSIESMTPMAAMHFGLGAFGAIVNGQKTVIPSYSRPQLENMVSSMDRNAVEQYYRNGEQSGIFPKGTTDKILNKLTEFDNHKEIVKNLPISEERKAAITGKLIQRDKLKEQSDFLSKYGSSFNDQVENINKQIEGKENEINALVGGAPIEQVEKDEITGERLSTPKPFEKLKSEEVAGIEVPKEYGEATTKQVASGEENKYKPTAVFFTKKGALNIPTEIEIGDKTYSDKNKAQEIADKALKQHYYENELNDNLKPIQREKAQTEIPIEKGNEGSNTSNELVGSNEESQTEKNVGEDLQSQQKEVKLAVEPPKPISEMSSEEMDNYATDVRKELRKQDKVFENKTEDEKQKGGYYDVIDNYEDLRDTSTKINFIENSEGLDDLSSSVRSALGNIKDKPTEYDLAILNAAKKKAEELNISTDDLIKQVLKKEGNRYKDANDAEFMMKNALNKIVPSEKQTPLTTSNEGIVEKPLENKQPITKEEFHNNILQMAEGMKDSNFDWRLTIPEMSQKDREKAVADIRAGKDSKQAQKLKAYIDDAYEKNIITLNRGRGNQAQTVEFPLKEWFGEPLTHEELNHAEKIDDATAEIINNEGITSENIDNLKHLFYDKSQFPYNKTDFDNIKDYLARQDKGSAENKSISAQSETENLTNNTDNNAIREQRPTQEIPRTGNAGENITESSSEVRPSEQGNEATGTRSKEEIKNKNEEEVVGVHAEYPPTQLSHLGTEKLRTEFGGEDAPAKERETFLGWEREADEKISEGYDVEGLLDKMENDNHRPTPVEHIILTKQADAYAAKLREIRNINSPEFDKILDKADRLNRLSDVAGSEKGKELVARKFRTVNDDTLLGFLLQEKDLNKGAPLTEQQKITAVNEYERINAATDEFKKKYEDLQEKYSKLLAEREHKKNLASTKKNTKKTPKDYIEERELLIEKLKQQKSDQEKYLQERGIQKAGFGITLTTDMVKTIKDIVKSHVEETAQKLEDVVKAVHAELKDIFEGVTEKDIHDVIAGNYNEKKPKRSEVAERMQNLRIQAQLINRYEALLKGGEPKNERAKVKRNQEINDLREKILGLKKEEAEANKFYGESESGNKRIEKMEDELQRLKERRPKETTEKQQREISGREKELKEQIAEERKKIAAEEKEANTRYKEEIDPKVKALQSLKKRNEAELKKIQEQIKKGDFAPPEKKPILQDEEVRKNFTNAYKEAVASRDALIRAKRERALRLAKQMYENRTPREKTAEVIGKSLNVPRTLMTIGDFSAVFRQAAVATTAHPIIASKALKFMFKAAADEKVYNRWLDDVHNDPLWETAQKSNLPITDPESLHAREHEEAFYGSQYAEKLPLGVGWTVKASERAYNGYLNFIRWEMFKMYAERFAYDGLTIKNSEDLYKGISSFIGSATGRGGMSKSLETASPLLNTVLFASRLIAARLNTLGLSDIPNLGVQAARYAVKGATLGKFDPHWGIDFGFYTKLPPKIRIEAAKDMVKFVGVGMATLFLAKQMGADVEDDPRSSDFGKIRSGNTRWDIWGGFQPYARLTAQIITGQSKSTTTGKIYDLNGTKYGGRNIGDQIATFGRGKLSPIFGTGLDYFTKRTLDQQTLERRFALPSFMNNDLQQGHITLTDELIKNLTPLLFNDISDAMKDRGVSSIFTVGIPSLFGIGVQTYAPKTSSNKNGSSIKRPKVQKIQTHKVQGY